MSVARYPRAEDWLGLAGCRAVITGAGGGFDRTLMNLVLRPGFDRAEHAKS